MEVDAPETFDNDSDAPTGLAAAAHEIAHAHLVEHTERELLMQPALKLFDQVVASFSREGIPEARRKDASFLLLRARDEIMAMYGSYLNATMVAPAAFTLRNCTLLPYRAAPAATGPPTSGARPAAPQPTYTTPHDAPTPTTLPQRPEWTPTGQPVGENIRTKAAMTPETAQGTATAPPHALPSAPPRRQPYAAPQPRQDQRLFIRLGPGSKLHEARSAAMQEFLRRKVPAVAECMASLNHVDTGWALHPAAGKTQQLRDLASEIATACAVTTVEAAKPWIRLAVRHIPGRTAKIGDDLTVSSHKVSIEELSREMTKAFGAVPVEVAWSRRDEHEAPKRTALVAFVMADVPIAPRKAFLFGAEVRVEPRRTLPRMPQCGNCHGFHRKSRCQNHRRCVVCASTYHSSEEHATSQRPGCTAAHTDCRCPRRCANCGGDHLATDTACPARPRVQNGTTVRPTRGAIDMMRRANSKARAATNRCPGVTGAPAPPNSRSPSRH